MLVVRDLCKSYHLAESELPILNSLNLEVERGSFVSIQGASGTGKSTLLHLLGGLDTPDSGEVLVDGESIFEGNENRIAERRNKSIGFVFQFHHLLPEFTAAENVAMPARIGGTAPEPALTTAHNRLAEVGLAERADHLPAQLSGGERQRVAIARSLVNSPSLLLMDEPTGNLDPGTGQRLFDLLCDLQQVQGLTLIMVTHNAELAERTDRQLVLRDGKLLPVS